jgi:hypothetical protein
MRSALLLVVLLGACKKDEGTTSQEDLEMVTAGGDPRRPLRYQLPKGAKQSFEVITDLELVAGEMGGPLPTLVMSVLVAVEDVTPDQRMKLHTTIVEVAARDRFESKIPAAALSGPLDAMKGVTFEAMLGPTGRMSKPVIEGDKQLTDVVRQQLLALTGSFDQVAMPLPAEPVGAGAVWRTSRPIEHNGMKMTAVSTVAITSIAGDTIAFTLDTDIHGKDQTVTHEGATVEMKHITGTGRGSGSIELTSLKISSELTAEFRSEMTSPGEDAPTPMRVSTVTKVTPK